MTIYLAFCLLKSLYVLVLFAVYATDGFYLLVLAVQLWVTNIVYKFWKLLGSVSRERAKQLTNDAYAARSQMVFY